MTCRQVSFEPAHSDVEPNSPIADSLKPAVYLVVDYTERDHRTINSRAREALLKERRQYESDD